MKAFVVCAMVIAIVAGAAVDKKDADKPVAAAEGEKKQDKRGLWDLGYGYESSHHGWEPSLKLSHGWEDPHVTTIIKKEHVPVPYEVKVPVPVTVEKHVPVVVEKKVPVYIEKPVAYPVKVPYKVKEYVEVPKPYPVHIEKPYPVIVKKPVYVEKAVPVVVKSHGWEPHHSHSYSEIHSWH